MVLGRFRSLQKRLLRLTGRGVAVPLRAYGKLELAPEYVDVGCDELPAGRNFRTWINEGCKRLQAQFQNDRAAGSTGSAGVRLRRHRMLLSVEGGRIWVVGCLWHSSDKRSEQGSQRNFPFVLFALVPAPAKKSRRTSGLPAAAAFCTPLWEQMEQVYPSLTKSRDRADCTRLIRQRAVLVDAAHEAAEADPLVAAENIQLAQWVEAITAEGGSSDGLFWALQRRVAEFRRSKGRDARVWRLPLAINLGTLAQLGSWLFWLDGNLGCRSGEFGFLLPIDSSGCSAEFTVLLRRVGSADFESLSANPPHVDRALGPPLIQTYVGNAAPVGRESFVRVLMADVPPSSRSLAAFARMLIPKATRNRG